MSTHDFDRLIDRRGTNSYKWDDCESDVIPMWVADMDFATAPAIIEALQRRVEHGIFGYTLVPDGYYQAFIDWFERRHGWPIEREWIQYTSGVVPALSVIVKALTRPGDRVIVQTPVYNCFYSSIRNNGCEVAVSPLKRVELDDNLFTYQVDEENLEHVASDPRSKLMIVCNPHNPAGRVWTPDELERVNEICRRNGVRVVSDEIHCELVMSGHTFTPMAAVSRSCQDNVITCNSPSKSFNTAGLQIANIICNDAYTRARIDRAININEVCDVNPFGVIALQAAYTAGEEWLTDLCAYIEGNYRALLDFMRHRLPHLPVSKLEGTYLPWIDISALDMGADALALLLLQQGRVQVNAGTMYDPTPDGEHYIRLNIACPRDRMMEGLERKARVIDNLL